MDSAPDESPFQQVIPRIPQKSLYPSLAAMGTSINTVVSPSILFARKVINDIEKQQRKTLKGTVEGIIRLTNTSAIPEEEGKEEEVLIYKLAQLKQIPKRKLQPESLKIEDTSTKQVYMSEDQNVGLTEAQNMEDKNEQAVLDSIDSQIEDDGSTLENNDHDFYQTTKILQCKMIRCLKHPKMTIIIPPLMMMILMTQSSLATQSLNHFCQEALEYPLQR